MSAVRPSRASQPVPPRVLQRRPYVLTWSWQSKPRLRGERPEGNGAYLVVISDYPRRPRYIGQGIGPGTSAERISEIYADLHVALARNIGHETAGLDGAPVRAGLDHDRCRFSGLLAAEHEAPGDAGPVYQATHVTWGPGTPAVTTAEAEAAICVELEAMKHRGSLRQPGTTSTTRPGSERARGAAKPAQRGRQLRGRVVMFFPEGAGEYPKIPPAISVWTARCDMFGRGLGDRRPRCGLAGDRSPGSKRQLLPAAGCA